jgi:hypothetical protein
VELFSAYQPVRSVVFSAVRRRSCQRIILRQKELAFIKTISTLQVSPSILMEVRIDISRRKKKPAVPAKNRSTASGLGAGAPLRTSRELVGKRKANELASSGGSPKSAKSAQGLAMGPRLCPRVHRQSRAKKLPRAAGNSVRPRVGRRTRLS